MYVAASWSPMTWVLMFSCMALAILAVFVTFVIVLVRAANATPPPRRTELVAHPGGGEVDAAHDHPHAA
ncbi:hypothetical protein [Nocardioides ultimimeridianus]